MKCENSKYGMLRIWNVCVDREASHNEAVSAVGFRGLEKGKKEGFQ